MRPRHSQRNSSSASRNVPASIGLASTVAIILGLSIIAVPASAVPGSSPVGGEQLTGKRTIVTLGEGADPLPQVWAKTWVVANADTGEILAAKGPHVLRAPASTLKTLTALTLIPQIDPSTMIKAKKRAVNTYGTKVGLVRGRDYTANDLFYALLLPSANDAAMALAQGGGKVKTTLAQMNQIADSLGALDTVAKNPSGLDAPGQVSSAYDLATIGRSALALPYFREIVSGVKHEFSNKKKSKTIYTQNRMLLGNFKGTIGLKTGFTTNAGRTFIGAAQRKGTTYIVSLMGIQEASSTAAEKLLTWAFANGDKVTPIGVLGQNTLPAASLDSFAQSNTDNPVDPSMAAEPTSTTTAGSGLDGLAVGWMILFAAIVAVILYGVRSAFTQRKNRARVTGKGKITLEG
jgi:D-alanyl-D-alanine carboxypeptidase (penicillin-binding protein 5/6)